IKCSVDWASFSPDGRRIVTFSGNRSRRYHRFQEKEGKTIASSSGGGFVSEPNLSLVHVWDADSGKLLYAVRDRLNPLNSWSGGLSWGPNSHSIASGHVTGFLDLDAGKWFVMPGIWSDATVSFSSDGRHLLAQTSQEANILDLATLETTNGWQSEQMELRRYSSNGKETVTTATRLDCRSIKKMQLAGHGAPLTVGVFSPDGRWVVTGSEDRTARIWNVETGKLEHLLQGHVRRLSGAAFSP